MSHRDENTESKVYVGDLPKDAEEKELERAFSYYGRIKSVWLARNPPGFAFIEYEDPKDAEDAVRGLDGNTICGVKARVEHATGKKRQKPWQSGGGGGGRGGGWGADRYGGGGGGGGARRGFDPDDRCFQCGERGHHSRDCHQKRGGGGGGYGGDRGRDDRGSARRRRSPTRSRSRDRRRSPSRSPSRSRSRERARD